MAVLGVIAFAAVMVFILFVRFRRKKRHRRYPTQNRKVLVRKGMNISKIVAGEEKGDHFSGNLKQQKTFFADPAVKICRIRLENSKTEDSRHESSGIECGLEEEAATWIRKVC